MQQQQSFSFKLLCDCHLAMHRSYYIALPLTLLPGSIWHSLQRLTVQMRLPDGQLIAAVLKALGGRLAMTQAVVSSGDSTVHCCQPFESNCRYAASQEGRVLLV